jgi:hypothetical protein
VQLGVPFWVGPDKQLVEPSRPGAPVPAAADRLLAQMAIAPVDAVVEGLLQLLTAGVQPTAAAARFLGCSCRPE